MDLRQLRYFSVLAEEKHFGRAARRLSLSQPPLSQAIRQLETELGARLFERTSRQVSLTPAGAALQREAQAILQRTAEARILVEAIAKGRRGRLRVGFSGSMIYRRLPEILKGARTRLPDVDVALQEMNSAEQIEALRHDELNLGFVYARGLPAGLDGFRYDTEPFVACLPARHHLARASAGKARVMRLQALKDEDFVLFARKLSPDYYESIIAICVAAGFLPTIKYEARQWLSVVALVSRGLGVALVPQALAGARIGGVRFLPIPATEIRSETWCLWRRDDEAQAIRDGFLTEVRAHRRG